MKYRTTGVKMGHKLFKRERVSQFDKNRHIPTDKDSKFEDYKKLDLLTHAEFQKELFKKRKQERKRYRMAIVATILITLITILLFLFIWDQLGTEMFEFSSHE